MPAPSNAELPQVPPMSTPAEGALTGRLDGAPLLAPRRAWRGLPHPPAPGRYLAIELGSEFELLELTREVTHVGRGLQADVRLDDHLVSRRHAIIVEGPTGARIIDDRSANGVVLNGRPVDEADLHDGDVIVLGRSILRYIERPPRRHAPAAS